MKANFKIKKNSELGKNHADNKNSDPRKELTEEEFEEFIIKSGAKGSFMIFRTNKKEDELGLEEL